MSTLNLSLVQRTIRCMDFIPFPNKKYSVIYADPPWSYEQNMSTSGGDNQNQKWIINADNHYDTMTVENICDFPVCGIADKDCLLFMWATCPLLPEAIRVGVSWGFKYATVGFVWNKKNINPGYYTMSGCELCLIFKKGKIPQPRGKRNIRQLITCKRGEHSVKPYEVRHRISEMFPNHDKIELFARDRFHGWDAWGNEIDNPSELRLF